MGVLNFILIIKIQEILKKGIIDFWNLLFLNPIIIIDATVRIPLGYPVLCCLWFSCPSQNFYLSLAFYYIFILSVELHVHCTCWFERLLNKHVVRIKYYIYVYINKICPFLTQGICIYVGHSFLWNAVEPTLLICLSD